MDSDEAAIGTRAIDSGDRTRRTSDLAQVKVRRVQIGFVRQRIEKADRIRGGGVPKLRPIASIPGHDLVELRKGIQSRWIRIDAGGGDRTNAVCKTDQRDVPTRCPDYGVL